MRFGLIFLFLITFFQFANAGVRVEGVLRERGTRAPLEGVNLFILPHKLKAVTDPEGKFVFEDVPEGPFSWVINLTGYLKLELGDQAAASGGARELYLEKSSYQVYETTIFGREKKRDDTTRSLKVEKAMQAPGNFGDPIKAVQNLPGVGRTSSSQVVIQGSEPRDTRYMIENHEIPLIFHFGGSQSVLFPEATDRIDLLTAGYGADYSRALGGQINVFTKTPRKDRLGGVAFVDLINSGLLLEGPVGKTGSLLISGRQSYIGLLLKEVMKSQGEDSGVNLTVAPGYRDLSAIYHNQLTEKDEVKVTTIGSQDYLELLLKEPLGTDPSIRGSFDSKVAFFRLIPQWKHKHDDRNTSRWSLSYGYDSIAQEGDDLYFRVLRRYLGVRGELENIQSEKWTQFIGIDNQYSSAQVEANLPSVYSSGGVTNPVSSGEKRQVNVGSRDYTLGAYWRNDLKFLGTPWSIQPQLRYDYFKRTKEHFAVPRFAQRYEIDESLFLRASQGVYFQQPLEQEAAETYGNPDIKAPRAFHYTVGAEKDFRQGGSEGFKTNGGLFLKEFDRLVVPSVRFIERNGQQVAENYSNNGLGRAYGFELQGSYDIKPWQFAVNYTWSRSVRWTPGEAERVAQFDQTHNLGLQMAYSKNNWRFSGRYRFVTGNPITPIVSGVFDADNDVYVPLRGGVYSERAEPFQQLDLRVDRKWVYNTWILSAYLDILNAAGSKNPQSYAYSYDYSKREALNGLPTIPVFGVKGEF